MELSHGIKKTSFKLISGLWPYVLDKNNNRLSNLNMRYEEDTKKVWFRVSTIEHSNRSYSKSVRMHKSFDLKKVPDYVQKNITK